MADIEAIERDIKRWDSIDHHRTGTTGDTQTSEWLADEVFQVGFEPVIDAFAFPRWVLNDCSIEISGHRIEGVPLFDGATTPNDGVDAPLTGMANPAGIGVGSLSPATVPTFAKARRVERPGIVAIAAMDAAVPGLALQNAPRFTKPFGSPVLQVASEHESWLDGHASAGSKARLTVAVEKRTSIASNVQTRITGTDPDLAPIVVMTPKSAWWVCTAERSGGIAVWLAALRHLRDHPPRRNVIFTANTGHELGHTGLEHFLAQEPGLAANAHAWFHLGANFIATGGAFRVQVSDAEIDAIAHTALETAGERPAAKLGPGNRPFGEAENIFDRGGRYVSFLGSNPWFHHPDDRWPTTIDLDKADRITTAALTILDRLGT